jgi:hypothetical protein
MWAKKLIEKKPFKLVAVALGVDLTCSLTLSGNDR